jgi:hypothetical protein
MKIERKRKISNKIAVVTSIFGGIDEPIPFPAQIDCPPCDRILITSADSEWNYGERHKQPSPREQARRFKMLAHKLFPHYKTFIWIDGNVRIKSNDFVSKIISLLDGNDIAIGPHPVRNCIYEEAQAITRGVRADDAYLGTRYDQDNLLLEARSYRRDGHPAGYGLYWCGLFARKVDARVNRFFDQWWAHCQKWPRSIDQLAFPYLVRKLKMKIGLTNWGNYHNNSTYRLIDHSKLQ